MGDAKRFWKESIGVTGPVGDTGPVGAPPSGTGLAERNVPEPIDTVLGSLPIGSIGFSEEAARRLWPHPTATELKDVAVLAEGLVHLPQGPLRDTALRPAVLRQNVCRILAGLRGRTGFDLRLLDARAAEWTQLAQHVLQADAALAALAGKVPARIVDAARRLLDDPADLEAEAQVAFESAVFVRAVRAAAENGTTEPALLFPEAEALCDAIRGHRPRPADDLFLSVLAASTLVDRALTSRESDALDRARRAIERVGRRLEDVISRALADHRRDPERNAVLAAWRRRVAQAATRLERVAQHDASLAAAAQQATPQPATPRPRPTESAPRSRPATPEAAAAAGRAAAAAKSAAPAPDTPDLLPLDDAVVADLGRRAAREAAPSADDTPRKEPRSGWRKWFTR